MTSKKEVPAKTKRNTKAIWFNEAEYQAIRTIAKQHGLYPRQLIMLKVAK